MDHEEATKLLLEQVNQPDYTPQPLYQLELYTEAEKTEKVCLIQAVDELIKEGKLAESKKGKLMLPEKMNLFSGRFHALANGNGYVKLSDNSELYIYKNDRNTAMHNDEVQVQVLGYKNGKATGSIQRILERGANIVTGDYGYAGKQPALYPQDKRIAEYILLPKQKDPALQDHKLAVRLTKPRSGDKAPEGKIIKDLGHKNAPGVDILAVVYAMDIPAKFPGAVKAEASALPDTVPDTDLQGRRDITDQQTITIDGEDTKDIDDAVSLTRLPDGGFSLTVSIADVAHYVREGSSLDREARKRGTSVYLADRVIPMLPEKLSNGLCSLNEGVRRLALSCRMTVNSKGVCTDHEIFESLIQVDKKMAYPMVYEMLTDETSPQREIYSPYLPMLVEMAELAKILQKKRAERGAIEFDFPEAKVVLDAYGKPADIAVRSRNIATAMIEEFMILCNETVAEAYHWLEQPFIYRCHEEPDSEKALKLGIFLKTLGYGSKGKGIKSKSFQSLIMKAQGTPEEMIVNKVILRSLKQARYVPENIGHFGLASDYYCHFTSPIRRYPDLMIHRIIKAHLNQRLSGKAKDRLKAELPEICRQCSLTERRAESCEREVETMKKVEFMADKIGERYEGIISGLTSWGIYVSLPNTIEGMVSLMSLEDDYHYDENSMTCIGAHTGNVYRLGQKVSVRVFRANIEERKLDFRMV